MPKPKVFVTRQIPDAGLSLIRAECDADVSGDHVVIAISERVIRASLVGVGVECEWGAKPAR